MFWGKKKQKQKVYSGFPGDCSPDQIVALENFRQYVYENKNIDPKHYDEIYLLRFLRARKFDTTKTKLMWDNFVKWRVKNNIDHCLQFKFPQLPELRKMYPHGYHKVDKLFRPIYIQRVGSIDVQKIFKVMSTQNLLNYYALLYETLLTTIFDGCTSAKLKANGGQQRVAQTITILDLKHVKLGSASKAYDFVKPVSAMAQDNYPQILGNMFIINAPMLFTGIWTIVKMWIDDKTKEKIKILGGSYKKQLLQYIDPENLPDFLDGGKCKCQGGCQLDKNIGPWNPEGKQMLGFALGQQQEQSKIQKTQVQKQQVCIAKELVVKSQQANQKKDEKQISLQKATDVQIAKQQDEQTKNEKKQEHVQQQKVVQLCVMAGLIAEEAKYQVQNQQAKQNQAALSANQSSNKQSQTNNDNNQNKVEETINVQEQNEATDIQQQKVQVQHKQVVFNQNDKKTQQTNIVVQLQVQCQQKQEQDQQEIHLEKQVKTEQLQNNKQN